MTISLTYKKVRGQICHMDIESEQQLIDAVATEYLNNEKENLSSEYNALAEYNVERFDDIPINVEFVDDNPYSNAKELFDACESGELEIWNGGEPSHMDKEANLKGRAVHDYFGHFKNRVDFSMMGEFEKWYKQREDAPDHVEDLLFSEVVGQNAVVHYLDDGFSDERYEQRSVLISDEVKDAAVEYFEKEKGIRS